MSTPVRIIRHGHVTFLKWHRARRQGGDPAFTGRRILEGMAAGASVEVDLVLTRDRGFAVLHDLALDRETTGTGPVAATGDDIIRQLRLRGEDGTPLPDPVMLLDDLCALMASGTLHPDALLQLDYKQDETVLDDRAVANFARATRPVAGNLILSSGSAAANRRLAAAVPGLRTGFDPSDEAQFRAALETGTLQGFVDAALAAAPDAELIYLDWRIVTLSAEAGFDIVAAFHAAGKRIDAWTLPGADPGSVEPAERLLALKVDQITTDDPEGLLAALEQPR